MTETTYQIRFWIENKWTNRGWSYDIEEAARKELVYHLNTGYWKPEELRIVKVTSTANAAITITQVLT